MKRTRSGIIAWMPWLWASRVLPILRAFFSSLWKILGILLICTLFKYLFLANCLDVSTVKVCATSTINDSNTLFTIGGLLLALFVMIPTFWIDSKIKDASKEVKEEILKEVREDMQRVSQAQMLIAEAEKFGSPSYTPLKQAEHSIRRAVEIWPPFRAQEYRWLAIILSTIIIDSVYKEGLGGISPRSSQIREEEIPWFITTAIHYLEETVLDHSSSDTEALVYLSYMYGYQKTYNDMITTIERAIKIDPHVKEKFQQPRFLIGLLRACHRDRGRIENLGRKIGVTLPQSKQDFCIALQQIDLVAQGAQYLQWKAIERSPMRWDGNTFLVTIRINVLNGAQGRKASAHFTLNGQDEHVGQDLYDQRVSLDTLFEELDKKFLLICRAL